MLSLLFQLGVINLFKYINYQVTFSYGFEGISGI